MAENEQEARDEYTKAIEAAGAEYTGRVGGEGATFGFTSIITWRSSPEAAVVVMTSSNLSDDWLGWTLREAMRQRHMGSPEFAPRGGFQSNEEEDSMSTHYHYKHPAAPDALRIAATVAASMPLAAMMAEDDRKVTPRQIASFACDVAQAMVHELEERGWIEQCERGEK